MANNVICSEESNIKILFTTSHMVYINIAHIKTGMNSERKIQQFCLQYVLKKGMRARLVSTESLKKMVLISQISYVINLYYRMSLDISFCG